MIILGLGSNLGNRQLSLDNAIKAIESDLLENIIISEVHETEPLLPPNPQPGWRAKKFLNMAICGELKIDIEPEDLLQRIKQIESQLGRSPANKWAPRVIDVDILAWDDLVYNSENLHIPHAAMLDRQFVIAPMCDIAPEWVHPVTGRKICSYLE
jgi:2-amino-4-hydroxy-6-hydroxymethyldihydropteridine diphosphokinase/dihydropteroate synthase